ncbi:PREDICTED: uncharacterized protein LOC109590171 [Amphimedon queenslandica]|uniref:Uncharacterized protein n=1 Tax=Amphimedon queenslandica TaxID=400682 RepID=A0AAN0JXI1_AMPQE|nr:PREDICTED: uncharacterized protein LOC109590171 [Amphimedon queenslandica]|eukprot:XP_019861655.1 PREDICTED: uncharacterized protein LOC109590171 [Amphimedon queenslandica]
MAFHKNKFAEVLAFLHTFATDLSLNNLEQINAVIQSLIELCVGNIRNQVIAFNKLVMDPVNRILQLQLKKHDDCLIKESEDFELIKKYVEVKGSVVELLDVMLEEISPQTLTLAKGIGSSLDVNSVLLTMKMFHELQSLPLIKEQKLDDDCERGRNKAYQVLVALIEYKAIDIKDETKLMKRAEEQSCEEALNSCKECSHSIEIHYEEDGAKPIIARIHFPFKAKLREVATELVRWNINRDSMDDKQRALVDLMPALRKDVLHQTKLKETKVMKPFLAYSTVRSRLLMLLTIILNIFVLFVYTVPDKEMGSNR